MFNQKSRFRNLGSLYDMNREENSSNKAVSDLEKEEDVFRQERNTANSRFASGNTAAGNDALGRAKAKAKTISDAADSFNPESQMRQRGLAGRAAGVSSFYSGQAGPDNTDKMKRFSKLYSTISGEQDRKVEPMKPMAWQDPDAKAPRRYEGSIVSAQNATNRLAASAGRGPKVRAIEDLEWLYKTGRISPEDFEKARREPAFFETVMKNNGFGE